MVRVLIIGDSQAAGPPGQILEGLLEGAGVLVRRIGISGQGAYDWSREHWSTYQSALSRFRPDDVILIFGSNDSANTNLELAMKRFADSGPRVWYAGPPRYGDPARQARGDAIRSLARRVFRGRYLDAWPSTGPSTPRRADGIHFNPEGARTWALDMLRQFGRPAGTIGAAMVALGIGVAAVWWISTRRID